MKAFPLTVSSPDGNLFQGEVTMLTVRGTEGELAVMAGHIPFVTAIVPCTCKLQTSNGEEKKGRTEGGLLTVSGQGVTILTGSFQWC